MRIKEGLSTDFILGVAAVICLLRAGFIIKNPFTKEKARVEITKDKTILSTQPRKVRVSGSARKNVITVAIVATIREGKTVPPWISKVINPQATNKLTRYTSAGARFCSAIFICAK